MKAGLHGGAQPDRHEAMTHSYELDVRLFTLRLCKNSDPLPMHACGVAFPQNKPWAVTCVQSGAIICSTGHQASIMARQHTLDPGPESWPHQLQHTVHVHHRLYADDCLMCGSSGV